MARYIGVDLGSTSICAVLIDTDRCEVVDRESADNDTETTSSEDGARGYSEWDIERMTTLALGLVGKVVGRQKAEGIEAIGVTGQQHGMVLMGDDHASVSPFIGWQDRRCQEPFEGDKTYIEAMVEAGGDAFAETGCTPATGYMGSTLYWLKQHGALPPGLWACFAPDYVVGELCGETPVTDPTLAASSGLYHVVDDDWHEDLIEALGLDLDAFPEVADPCDAAGALCANAAEATGLPEGLPVAVPCGDNQASFAGSVADYGESVLVTIGTGGQTSVYVEEPLRGEGLDLRPFLQPGYLMVGAGLAGGKAIRILRDFFRDAAADVFGVARMPDIYERLVELAGKVPSGAEGLRCEPIFSGTRQEPERRAVWSGMSEANFTPGHMARALIEGMAEQYHGLYRTMVDAGAGDREQLVGSGNGIRMNALIRESLGQRFDHDLTTPTHTEEAAVGAALTAAVSVGEFDDIQAASRRLVRYDTDD